ncbi:hypothetical protein M438DRAFT_406023 [Aureobasidium pullulans EXF-150]|uniref:Uncharacterized protein n=1 Tax=Aureobasidium pullulans EXF-150 TaxID=1043002 RepID=A0A074XEQ5_AURPU|nr:uncharacterized protein M438DRAFT_406023 [Aureobasidium pullulans EXF-150]KEQ83908.1 hypothetical protein M438DRAFT_406023 [Aureobasidium pullulans EXF-150]
MGPQQVSPDARQQELQKRVGLLSKTLASTPTLRQIIPVRMRSSTKDDYVCVGKDYIQLFEIESEVRITHIATKNDFDGEIGAANAIGYFDPYESEFREYPDDWDNLSESSEKPMGPQMLTFTLKGTDQLFFLTTLETEDGEITFRVSCIPMPKFTRPSRLLGNAIAVDSRSRALAVAAGEREIFICYANQAEYLSSGNQKWDDGFIPVSSSRIVRVPGTILLLDFLFPPKHDPDRVILLMIVLHQGSVRPAWVEWSYCDEVRSADIKQCHRILSPGELPNLLIPLKGNAAFVLTTRRGITIFEHILTTSILSTRQGVDRADPPKDYPPSSHKPLWACWVRPRRDGDYQIEDYIYLVTEDGNVYYMVFEQDLPAEGVLINHVGSVNCHVDSACAPFGRSDQGDILIVQGASSEGCVWMSECRQAPASDSEPNGGMHGFVVSALPNWSENLDLVAKPTSRKRLLPNSRDTLFVPSGRQPYGHVTELRMGLEAQIGHQFSEHLPFGNISHAWVLQIEQEDLFFFLLSSPGQTHVLSVPQSPDGDSSHIQVIEPVGLDLKHSTLAATMINDHYILQITESGLFAYRSPQDSLLVTKWPSESRATAAAIEDTIPCAVIASRKNEHSAIELLKIDEDEDDGTVSSSPIGKPVQIDAEIISVAIYRTSFLVFVIAGTSDGTLHIFRVSPQNGLELYLEHDISQDPNNLEALNACEDILILGEQVRPEGPVDLVVLCGLRGGSVYALELQVKQDFSLQIKMHQHFSMGLTTAKLRPGKTPWSAFAACGDGFFGLKLTGPKLSALNISDVYLTEVGADGRAFQQESVTAMSMVPYAETSPLSEALIVFSNDSCYITAISEKRGIVPKKNKVRGSPHILIESKPLNCFVSASSYGRLRSATSRTVHDVIQFILPDARSTYDLDVGLKVYAMTEWSFRRTPESAPHVFIAVAVGRPVRLDGFTPAGSHAGWIYLLRLVRNNKDKATSFEVEVEVSYKKPFESPVTAISTYGETDLVVCSGTKAYFLEYDTQTSRFNEVCHFVMHSPGIRVTTSPPHVHITTERDSTLTLQLMGGPADAGTRRLHNVGRGDGARQSASHTTIDVSHDQDTAMSLNLTSTLERELVGLRIPDPSQPPMIATHDTLFTAELPRSVMRIVEAKIRPPWKPATAPGVLKDDLVGITVDGTVYGFAILDERTTNRLRWVQRLCQRNPDICPFTYSNPPTVTQNGMTKELPVMLPPAGFDNSTTSEAGANGELVKRSKKHRPSDMHVDGDFLVRLLEQDGAELLTSIMELEATQANDPISIWMRDNLEAQKREVDALIAEAAAAVDRWW